jgi:hypothetical protein
MTMRAVFLHTNSRRRKGLLLSALVLALGFVLPARAAETTCAGMVEQIHAGAKSRNEVAAVQLDLAALGFSPDGVDGEWGPKTQEALVKFCANAVFARGDTLLATLHNHVAISRVFPDWLPTMGSLAFEEWAAQQPDADIILHTRQSGSVDSVIALVARYRARNNARNSFVPVIRGAETEVLSYVLTKDDFKQLKSTTGVFKQVQKLPGTEYANPGDLNKAVDASLKGVPKPAPLASAIEPLAQPQVFYSLTAESLKNAVIAPDYLLDALKSELGKSYPTKELLREAVQHAAAGIDARLMQLRPQIDKLAQTTDATRLSQAALNKFVAQPDDLLAEAVKGRIQPMTQVEYQNPKTFDAAVSNILHQMSVEMADSIPVIVGQAKESTLYSFTGASGKEIGDKVSTYALPEIYLELIASLQGVEYPDEEVFWQATVAEVTLEAPKNPIRLAIFSVLEKHAATQITPELLAEMEKEKVPPAVVAQLGELKDKFPGTKQLETRVNRLFVELGEQYDQFKPLVTYQAMKQHPFDAGKPVQWSGKTCNCVHDNLSGEVYGFYPYWLAGGNQYIDFSVTTRVGFYALDFDDSGSIPNASWWSGQDIGFIREAQTYGSKVDLVLYRNDWETWGRRSASAKAEAFNKLADNIDALLNAPMPGLLQGLKPYVSLGLSTRPVMGDGVTLFFDNYPNDNESVEAFGQFIGHLGKMLDKRGHDQYVNIMFRSSEIGKGIYGYRRLLAYLQALSGGDGYARGLFIVQLREPTTHDKKQLRANIEDSRPGSGSDGDADAGGSAQAAGNVPEDEAQALHGEERVKVLRSIVMVIGSDGRDEHQLNDDVIYAKDTYGGIGFWPLPVAGKPELAAQLPVNKALHSKYMADGSELAESALNVCKIVCPNRWLFRLAWGVFFLALLASAALYIHDCTVRTLLDNYFLHYVGGAVIPFVLLTLALLACDPGWEKISRGHGVLIFVLTAVIGYGVWNYRDKKAKARLPR